MDQSEVTKPCCLCWPGWLEQKENIYLPPKIPSWYSKEVWTRLIACTALPYPLDSPTDKFSTGYCQQGYCRQQLSSSCSVNGCIGAFLNYGVSCWYWVSTGKQDTSASSKSITVVQFTMKTFGMPYIFTEASFICTRFYNKGMSCKLLSLGLCRILCIIWCLLSLWWF